MALILSDVKSKIHYTRVKNDTWNFERKSKSEEDLEKQRIFEADIQKNGVTEAIVISRDKDDDGLFVMARGRRRLTAIQKAVEKGILSEKDPRTYLPYRTVEGDYWDNEIRMQAVYGDNDNRKNYTPEDRQRIILDRYGAKEILKTTRGGHYRDGKPVGQTAEKPDSLELRIHRETRWSKFDIRRDLAALRKHLEPDKNYADLSEDKIDQLNKQFLSWWERKKQALNVEREMKKTVAKYKTEIEKINQDARTFSQGFPAGGPEAYAKNAIRSKRADFRAIREIRGLREYVEGGE